MRIVLLLDDLHQFFGLAKEDDLFPLCHKRGGGINVGMVTRVDQFVDTHDECYGYGGANDLNAEYPKLNSVPIGIKATQQALQECP